MMKRAAIALVLALGATAALAQLAEGEIRKVDKEAKRITIKHGPVPSIEMPPMTMVFQVKDAALLERVKAGDKVRFDAQKIGGQYFVTKIEPAK
jgi:Cu/Ag efflux protein CusF